MKATAKTNCKSTTKSAKPASPKADLIAEFRRLGTEMKQLRTSHLADIEKLIEKYKADKKAIQEKREQLLKKIRKTESEKAAA